MSACVHCGKPIDFSRGTRVEKFAENVKVVTITVKCPYCGKWNTKEIKQ